MLEGFLQAFVGACTLSSPASPTRARWSEPRKPGPLGQANLIGLRGEIAALYSEVGRRTRLSQFWGA